MDKSNYERALPLAIEAGQVADTAETCAALRGTFAHLGRTLAILAGHDDFVSQASWNGDESLTLTVSGKTVRRYYAILGTIYG